MYLYHIFDNIIVHGLSEVPSLHCFKNRFSDVLMPGMRSPDSAVDFKAESSHDVDQQVNFT